MLQYFTGITILNEYIYMSRNQIGPTGYYPSIVNLLEKKDLIENDVQDLISLKPELDGDGNKSAQFKKLLSKVRIDLDEAIESAGIVGQAEGKQYETGKALMVTLKSLEAELAGLSKDEPDEGTEGLENSVLTANSAFLEVILVLAGLVFLLILCSTTALSKEITVVEILFGLCLLCVVAYYIYTYLFFNTSWLTRFNIF